MSVFSKDKEIEYLQQHILQLEHRLEQAIAAEKLRSIHAQVDAFHEKFNYPRPKSIDSNPSEVLIRFRMSLIAEEFMEMVEAAYGQYKPEPWRVSDLKRRLNSIIHDHPVKLDMPAFVDATGDLDYVVAGTRISLGVDMVPIALEIHRANMAKTTEALEAADKQKQDYKKRADGKLLKPEGWTPPDIEGELKKQGWDAS